MRLGAATWALQREASAGASGGVLAAASTDRPHRRACSAAEAAARGDNAALAALVAGVDADNDGMVTPDEIESFVAELGVPFAMVGARLAARGAMSTHEFAMAVADEVRTRTTEIDKAFAAIDTNGDGFITAPELHRALAEAELHIIGGGERSPRVRRQSALRARNVATNLMRALDVNNSRTLSREEFSVLLALLETREVEALTTRWEVTLLPDSGEITRTESRGGLAALRGRGALLDLAAGAFAGAASMTTTAPLEVLKARRIAFGASGGGMARALSSIMAEPGGWRNLFAGNGLKCLAIAPNRALDWLAFSSFKEALLNRKRSELRAACVACDARSADEAAATAELTAVERFAAGAAAGAVSKTLTFPLDLMSNRAMVPAGKAFYNNSGLLARMRLTAAAEGGAQALFRGLGISVAGIIPYAGVNYGLYDSLKGAWLTSVIKDPDAPIGAGGSLACGVVAGWGAMFVSYPLEVLRRRVQLECLGGCAAGPGGAASATTGAVARAMWREGGLQAFYRGIRVASAKIVPMAAVSFVAFEGALAGLQSIFGSDDFNVSAAEVGRTMASALGE